MAPGFHSRHAQERSQKAAALSGLSPLAEGSHLYYYRFEFGDFELGHFSATRLSHLMFARPLDGDWVCSAVDDQQALELARRAALDEWPKPGKRGQLDFVVNFKFPPPASEFDRRR